MNPETIIKNATILDYRADSVCWFFKYSNFPGFNSGSLSIIGLEDYEQLNNYPPEDFALFFLGDLSDIGPLLHIHWVTLHHVAYKASYDCEPVIAGLGSVLFVFLKVVQELKDVVFRDFLESQFVYRGVRML